MISRDTRINLRILAIGALVFNAACVPSPSGQSNDVKLSDASYTCTSTYGSVDYVNNVIEYQDEWRRAELEAMAQNEGFELTYKLDIRNSKAYWSDSTNSKSEAISVIRRGNKVFFKQSRVKSGSGSNAIYGQMSGFLDLTTNRFQQSVEVRTSDNSLQSRYTTAGICSPR